LHSFLRGKFHHSLTGKLIAIIGISTILLSYFFWFSLTRYQEKELLKTNLNYGLFFGEHVRKATYYGMLIFHRELIQKTIEEISSIQGILNVNIFDKKGKIRYSSNVNEIGVIVDKDNPDCKRCHYNPEWPLETLSRKEKWIITEDEKGDRILKVIEPIYNEPACYTAECHVHSEKQKILGIVKCRISLAAFDAVIKKQKKAIAVYIISFTFVISLAICIVLWRFVSKPVNILVEGMEIAGGGNMEHKVEIKSRDEMGILADAFNAMIMDLKNTKEYLASIETEKLAFLGRMAAGVAHEINNPLTGIVIFAHLLHKRSKPDSDERKDLEVIIEQADRCKNIIKGLLDFARSSPVEKTPINVNTVLSHSIQLVNSKAEFQNIGFNINIDVALGNVTADPSRLQQVFLNMLLNAADAMDGRGTLTINTRSVKENGNRFAEIEFTDTGCGIAEENLIKIFEPFFTTKPVGKGTGLGLAVSHGIIEDHGGKIIVKSVQGEGTSFFIRLPFTEETKKAGENGHETK
jgi:two-component system NtrC family sensor kinase